MLKRSEVERLIIEVLSLGCIYLIWWQGSVENHASPLNSITIFWLWICVFVNLIIGCDFVAGKVHTNLSFVLEKWGETPKVTIQDKDIVALYTLGRCHKEPSGFEGPWKTNPLVFDNSCFKELLNGENESLIQLLTDKTLSTNPVLRPLTENYAAVNYVV